ncbi:amino acid synthesis family protein [Algihabitans sp.]|uniref:amino acid synthesis family protein n=1 Tax=Algihabitans sp. TaxID=2821514 RepID=UPI003BAD2A6F
MDLIAIRKIATFVEEERHEFGPPLAEPLIRGSVAMVMRNPYAGGYVEDITPLMEALKPVGKEMAERLIAAMGKGPKEIEGYGKGAIVGSTGELEHGALWHVPGGWGMREVLGHTQAIVPSSKKVGTLGTSIDIPVHHVNAAYVRSHFTAIEVRLPDAPRPDELVYILAMTSGPRPHARVGGLQAGDIKGDDGLR